MIPKMKDGLLPIYTGRAVDFGTRSPWETTSDALAAAFGTSPHRRALLRSLLSLRADLRGFGIYGSQWICGSFVEQRGDMSEPADIDLVTLVPPNDALPLGTLAAAHDAIKASYSCDHYMIDMGQPAKLVSRQLTYWFGLFSHQRISGKPKGIIEIDLGDDNDDAGHAVLASFAEEIQ